MADRVMDALEVMIVEKGIDTGDMVVREWLKKMAETGDTQAIKALFDRVDGPIPRADKLQHDGGLTIKVEYADPEP